LVEKPSELEWRKEGKKRTERQVKNRHNPHIVICFSDSHSR